MQSALSCHAGNDLRQEGEGEVSGDTMLSGHVFLKVLERQLCLPVADASHALVRGTLDGCLQRQGVAVKQNCVR